MTDERTLRVEWRLRMMAVVIMDPLMAAVLNAAADAWTAGDRGPLVRAVVAQADDLISEAAHQRHVEVEIDTEPGPWLRSDGKGRTP